MRNFIHQDLAAGRWFQISLAEQLGNVGSGNRVYGATPQSMEKYFYHYAVETRRKV